MWASSIEPLSEKCRVITLDLPGFGHSPLQSDTSTMDQMAQSVLHTLDELGVKDKAVFAGLSMGGYVLLQLLKIAPERVKALGFFSTRATADTPQAKEGRMKTIQLVQDKGVEALAEKMIPALLGSTTQKNQPKVVKTVKRWIQSANPEGVCAALKGMAARPDSSSLLATISVPSLVLAGEEDSLIPPSEMKALADQIPQAQFEMISGAGHLLNLEKTDRFNASFLKFLTSHVF